MKMQVTENLLFWILVFSLIAIAVISILIYRATDSVDYVNAFILTCTFAAIMINSFATWILKRLTSKQITMSIRPVIVCRIADGNCQVRNIGNGAALYIQSTEKSFLMDENQRKEVGIKRHDIKHIKIGTMACLEKNSEWHGLAIRMMDENKKEQGIGSYDQQLILSQFDNLVIEYRDIEGTVYRTHLKRIGNIFETDFFQ